MNETVKELLKSEIELLKIYAVFLIGLITGITGLLLKREFGNTMMVWLLMLGFIFLFIVIFLFAQSFYRIKKITKTFKQ